MSNSMETKNHSFHDSRGVTVMLVLVFMAILLGWNQYAYGDWSCAFSHCVRIKP